MVVMKPQDALEAIDAIVSTVPADQRPELFGRLQNLHPEYLGGVAVEGAQSEVMPGVPTWEQQLEGLSAERREAAVATREVLAKKYERPESDFSLVKTTSEKDGKVEDVFAVVLSATQGIDLGNPRKTFDKKRSWNSIDPQNPNDEFMVEVKGKMVDERKGLTLEVMRELTAQDPKINEWIWETGRPDLAAGRLVPVVDAVVGGAYRRHVPRGAVGYNFAFRPAVVLE